MSDDGETLKNGIKTMILRRLCIEDMTPEEIENDAPLFGVGEGLGLDSVDARELVVGLEQEFGVTIADAEVGRTAFASINALVSFVEEKRAS